MLALIWSMNLIYHKTYWALAEHSIRQLLSKYMHGNDIHEHRKQQNE